MTKLYKFFAPFSETTNHCLIVFRNMIARLNSIPFSPVWIDNDNNNVRETPLLVEINSTIWGYSVKRLLRSIQIDGTKTEIYVVERGNIEYVLKLSPSHEWIKHQHKMNAMVSGNDCFPTHAVDIGPEMEHLSVKYYACVMSFVKGEPLSAILHLIGKSNIDVDCSEICKSIFKVINRLHRLNIVHLDLHGGNIIIDFDESGKIKVKIIDFEHAREVNHSLKVSSLPQDRYFTCNAVDAIYEINTNDEYMNWYHLDYMMVFFNFIGFPIKKDEFNFHLLYPCLLSEHSVLPIKRLMLRYIDGLKRSSPINVAAIISNIPE